MIGHERARAELEADLPPVTLLVGPPSIGKKTLAVHLARYHSGTDEGNGLLLTTDPRLTAESARAHVRHADIMSRQVHFFVVALDDATEQAQNILLKTLENPPAHTRFLLTSSAWPLATIISRSRVYRLGLLSDEQVIEILLAHGIALDDAADAAREGRGQVLYALAAVATASRVRSVVSGGLKAARAGTLLETVTRSWTPDHARVLRQWASEAASGRWVSYSPEFAHGVTKGQARAILEVLTIYQDSRAAAVVALRTAFPKEQP